MLSGAAGPTGTSCDGSGRDRGPDLARTGMGPAWDGEKGSYKDWQWEAQAWLQMLGRGHCLGFPAPAWLGPIQDPPTEQQSAWMMQDTRDVFVLTFRKG